MKKEQLNDNTFMSIIAK